MDVRHDGLVSIAAIMKAFMKWPEIRDNVTKLLINFVNIIMEVASLQTHATVNAKW